MKIIPNYLTQQILIAGLVGLVSGFLNGYIMRYFSRLFEPAFDILFSFTVPGLVFGVCISLYLVFASQLSFAKSLLFAIMITPTWTAAAATSFIMFETWVGSYFPTPWSEFVDFLMGREELSRDIIISGPGMLLTGLIAGFVGAVGLVIVSAIILPSFRRPWLCGSYYFGWNLCRGNLCVRSCKNTYPNIARIYNLANPCFNLLWVRSSDS